MLNVLRGIILSIMIIAFLLCGCVPKITHNLREISVNPNLQIPSGDKMPLKMAIFAPEEFKNYTFPINQETFKGSIEVGRSIMVPFYSVMSSLFVNVVYLEDFFPGTKLDDPELQLVLLPKIDHFQWKFISLGPASQMEAQFTLSCEIYDPTGHLVHRVTQSGIRSNSTLSMAFSGLNAVESAEMPTLLVLEAVLNDLSSKISANREKLVSAGGKTSSTK